jgi:hypothetical protein
LYLRTSQTSGKDSLQIDADDTTVVPAARTRLRIDMLPNNQEDVAIFKGTAYVEGNGNRTRVRAGEHIALEEGHSELLPLNPSDSWEQWNLERDRDQSRSSKLDTYLPDELRGHSAELDANGKWVRVPEYGMVWRPTVITSDDWAPYRTGRWVWKGDDYVWISYENWGWVPYHYGRWAVVSGFGWCWVPPARGDVYWGPGYVGWYSIGDQVAWTPLAPGETFYAPRYYGPHSVVITKEVLKIKPIYKNRYSPGGFTVIKHEDFRRGRTVIQQPPRESSFSISVSIGSPRIKQIRESRMPIIKQTPPRVAPPRIEHRDQRELRDRFPRISTESGPDHRRQLPAPTPAVTPLPKNQTQPGREKHTGPPVATQIKGGKGNETRIPDTPKKRDENRQQPPVPPQQPTPPVSEVKPPRQEQLKREEDRRRTTLQQPAQQPLPVPTSATPPRSEQPRRENVLTPSTPQQFERPKRDEQRQTPVVQQPAPIVTPQRPEQPRRDFTPAATSAGQQQQPDRAKRDEQRQRPVVQQPVIAPVVPRVEPQKRVTVPAAAPPETARPRGENKDKKVWKVTTPENPGDKDSKDKGRKER